jgi:hypothetical protein
MSMKNKQMELMVKSESELDALGESDDLDEDELVELYYALELSKNNKSKDIPPPHTPSGSNGGKVTCWIL